MEKMFLNINSQCSFQFDLAKIQIIETCFGGWTFLIKTL